MLLKPGEYQQTFRPRPIPAFAIFCGCALLRHAISFGINQNLPNNI